MDDMPTWSLVRGDCVKEMHEMAGNGEVFQAVVTDPPYHLNENRKKHVSDSSPRKRISGRGMHGESWDGGDVAHDPNTWRACLNLLPPGGHLVVFSHPRTYHHMACAVEDAGFEVRDMLVWLRAHGMPKSRDVGKDVARLGGSTALEFQEKVSEAIRQSGLSDTALAKAVGRSSNLVKFWRLGTHVLSAEDAARLSEVLKVDLTPPAPLDDAGAWAGRGTALAPRQEPILLARKPLFGGMDVARTALRHGTGSLNVDACRIPGRDRIDYGLQNAKRTSGNTYGRPSDSADFDSSKGRWPPNALHDGCLEALLPDVHGFFYCARATKKEKGESKHPTVKPVALMRWLVRLVTPPGGRVLDPFAGTGTTGEACLLEGFDVVMVEREAEYQEDVVSRMHGLVKNIT